MGRSAGAVGLSVFIAAWTALMVGMALGQRPSVVLLAVPALLGLACGAIVGLYIQGESIGPSYLAQGACGGVLARPRRTRGGGGTQSSAASIAAVRLAGLTVRSTRASSPSRSITK